MKQARRSRQTGHKGTIVKMCLQRKILTNFEITKIDKTRRTTNFECGCYCANWKWDRYIYLIIAPWQAYRFLLQHPNRRLLPKTSFSSRYVASKQRKIARGLLLYPVYMSTSSDDWWVERKEWWRTVIAGSTSKQHEKQIKNQCSDIQPVAKTEKGNKIYSESNKSVLLTPIRLGQKISVA